MKAAGAASALEAPWQLHASGAPSLRAAAQVAQAVLQPRRCGLQVRHHALQLPYLRMCSQA